MKSGSVTFLNKKVNLFFIIVLILFSTFITTNQICDFDFSVNNDEENIKNKAYELNNNELNAQSANPNLTRLLYQINFNLELNAEDISITTHSTYRNDANNSIKNIIHIIDVDTIFVESRISTILVHDSEGELFFEWFALSDYQLLNISLRYPILSEEVTTFTVSYLLEDAVLKNPEILENYIIRWTLTNHEISEQFSFILALPNKFILSNSSYVPSLEPEADYISIDGTRFEWIRYDVLSNEVLTWTIRFEYYMNPTQSNTNIPVYVWILMVILFIIGLIVGGLSVFFIFRSRIDMERSDIVETLLSQPEKEILKIIKDEKGVTTQSKICSISNFSKAKVSYYINELEKKEIITRERWGRMNRIRLIDESFEKVYYQSTANSKNSH
ncbi:MAG TPA: winged helix-turn-helix transcriptional regulator [candidate division Zixibacteria bacterium]|nr:winged helix-turn-helix transcriptional regulator [candidate division Zixibacteria bacterium]